MPLRIRRKAYQLGIGLHNSLDASRLPSRRPMSSGPVPANPLPAYFMRGGTSKGIFLKASDVEHKSSWDQVFRGIMGSPDPYGRQLNGMGGGISSLSKIMLVAPSQRPDVDVEYAFVQVGIKDGAIDLSGKCSSLCNCGNLSGAVGPYALASGLYDRRQLDPQTSTITMSLWNTNTNKKLKATFPIKDGEPWLSDSSDSAISVDGISGKASRITMDYLEPGGAKTGKLFPTGNTSDVVSLPGSHEQIRITCLDCTNPTVYVQAASLQVPCTILPDAFPSKTLEQLEHLRTSGARLMGLDPTAQSQPKIALVGPPTAYTKISGEQLEASSVDLVIRALSMQQPHRAVPMTVAMATSVAARIPGTVVHDVSRKVTGEEVRIGHPSGKVSVGAEIASNGDVIATKVYQTARFLMKGEVYWK
ncbi:hypothetical protein FRB90_011099 [Tulasnella sp. 427]|nr:hypothetical protein FRB90_011099 [Tulasnella sp. 427]